MHRLRRNEALGRQRRITANEKDSTMREQFIEHRFNNKTQIVIDQANAIIDEYLSGGYSLTLRQLYYQFVARGLMANEQKNYKRLGDTLSKARLAGLVDWRALEDRTRNLKGWGGGFEDVAEYLSSIGSDYIVDIWEGQENYVEVWVEKDALVGVIEKSCRNWRAGFFACRGYTSQSEQYYAGKRFARRNDDGKECHVLHLGDHDPSGIDMTRDNSERLDMFSSYGVTVHRIALNMDQVRELNPPPNPAKETDSRHGGYVSKFGSKSWELDALDPKYIDNLIRGHMNELVDIEMMDARREYEEEGKRELKAVAENHEDIMEWLRDSGRI